MYTDLNSFKNANLTNKRVFIRMDYNTKISDGELLDTYKIYSSISTIVDVYNMNPECIIIGTHLGRPNGKYVSSLSCKPVYKVLKEILKENINETLEFTEIQTYRLKKLVFIENLRFYPEEEMKESNSNVLSTFFREHVDVVIVDAFGVLHRNAFSTQGSKNVYCGNLVQKEVSVGNKILKDELDLIILGGSKVSDKIPILESFIPFCKYIYVVGAMACTFLKHHYRKDVGNSKVKDNSEDIARIYKLAQEYNVEIHVADDYVVQKDNFIYITTEIEGCVMDIGPSTLENLKSLVTKSKKIFWNGPAGVIEKEEFSSGTQGIVKILSKHSKGKVVVGGGETAACVFKYGSPGDFYHVSTGGGSFLKFLSGDKLPGLEVLKK